MQLPKEFYCPITHEPMKDPVLGPDGQSYERAAILDWLSRDPTSPITREPMDATKLIPNIALRNAIKTILEEHKKSDIKEEIKVPKEQKEEDKIIEKINKQIDEQVKKQEEEKKIKDPPAEIKLLLKAQEISENKGLLHISIVPPASGPRKGVMLICVLDVSGSMDSPATEVAGAEFDHFSRLDLVKHSMNTIIHAMSDIDFLGIICFSDIAKVCMKTCRMDAKGKQKAEKKIKELTPAGNTNIWDALKMGLSFVDQGHHDNLNKSILLFTDGEPNVNPPRGIIPTLNFHLDKNCRSILGTFTMHTFGYGYALNSELLLDIANVGDGLFCYIPDSTMVGTIFVNYISNCLTSLISNSHIDINTDNICNIRGVGFEMPLLKIPIGSIQYGQTRDFILEFTKKPAPKFNIEVKFSDYEGNQISAEINKFDIVDTDFYIELSRCRYIETMKNSICALTVISQIEQATPEKQANEFLLTLKAELLSTPAKDSEKIQALIRDFSSASENEGQVGKAFSNMTWYSKWGKHYLRSLIRAHQLQICHNFKDPGVQLYGGKLFKETQNAIDAIFCELPAPEPSLLNPPEPVKKPAVIMPGAVQNHWQMSKSVAPSSTKKGKAKQADYTHSAGSKSHAAPAKYVAPKMDRYLDRCSGCFDGDGLVQLSNGQFKKVKELLKGDKIISQGKITEIICLVKYEINREIDLTNLNGVLITPWHPVLVNNIWKFPIEISQPQRKFIAEIYNLVLKSQHIVEINKIKLVTLGHGIFTNKTVSHEYFGTQRVIEDLKKIDGYEIGKITVPESFEMIRNSENNLVNGIQKN